MHDVVWHLARFFAGLGGFGLLLLGILDSSFLFMPLGNDLLVIALTARHHDRMLYYAAMATAGSVLGCLITDIVCRKGGREGLQKNFSGRSFRYVERKIERKAGPALALACVMPPPFPFTPFIIVMAAMQYPRWRMMGIVAVGRAVRFTVEGVLATIYGPQVLQMAKSPILQWSVIGLVVISLAGSALSIYEWVRRAKAGVHAG